MVLLKEKNNQKKEYESSKFGWNGNTAHTHTMETHSMEKVPSMEKFSINQTE